MSKERIEQFKVAINDTGAIRFAIGVLKGTLLTMQLTDSQKETVEKAIAGLENIKQ